MKIAKILYNNAVVVFSDQMHEKVVKGRGLAFMKKTGDELNDSKNEKIF